MIRSISRNELKQKLDGGHGPVLIEALPARYYDDGHIPGALHMPHDEVEARAAAALPDKQAEIVVYCASESCRNSHLAATTLGKLGYTNVAVYAGGKKDWFDAGLPLEKSSVAA